MSVFWTFLARIRAIFLGSRLDRDLADELDSHLEMLIKDYQRAGMCLEDATRAARLRLGGIEQTKEEVRDERRVPWIANFFRDVHEALRKWRRQPAVAAVTVLTLAVGVGANIAMYDLVDALMFRPPDGVHAPERVVSVRNAVNYVRYLDIKDRAGTLDLAAYVRATLSLGIGTDAAPICAECVTSSYFSLLGTQPVIGRTFRLDENAERREPGVILSYALWQNQFGGDPRALGRPTTISGRQFSIIGVAPRGFRGLEPESVDTWILLPVAPEICSFTGRSLLGSGGTSAWLRTIGRLRDGVALPQAAAEIAALASPEAQFERALDHNPAPELEPIQESRRDSRAEGLALWLAGGALVVLIIACANVAGLSSIRAIDRRREVAVRLQLGASRARILAQHMAEHLMLSLFSGMAAVVVAGWIAMLLHTFFPYGGEVKLFDLRLFAIASCLALLSGVLSGMVPALQASRIDATALSRVVKAAHPRSGFRSVLLVLQVALALVLVIGAGLFVRSVQNTQSGLGYDLDRVIIAAVDLRKAGYRSEREMRSVVDLLADRVRRLPNIESVSLSSGSLLGTGGSVRVRSIQGIDGKPGEFRPVTAVSPEYFAALGTRIIRGRAFTNADNGTSERAMIVDDALARAMWPDEPAVGKCVFYYGAPTCTRIVGISESRRISANIPGFRGESFIPLAQAGEETVPQLILIRSRTAVSKALPGIAAVIRGALPNLPFVDIRPLEELADAQARSWRLGRTIFSLFGTVALLLASVGLYAVLAFSVRQRVPEIGVRIALGATPGDVLRLVFRHALILVAAGWFLGIGAALIASKYIEKLLFQVTPTDTRTFISSSAILLITGIAGCLIPAVRAARVDPVVALRHE
ncbi:MAG: ADOP family duplicated permease [Acidobacteriota bacterium]|jgi:predicted permease